MTANRYCGIYTISTDEFDMIWILWLIEPVDLSASSEYASWSRHRHGEI